MFILAAKKAGVLFVLARLGKAIRKFIILKVFL